MVFQFTHVLEGWDEVLGKWRPKPFDLVAFKRVMNEWQETLADDGWNALFLSNHDLPRQVSRYGSESFRAESAKALATALHLMKGTPFVYQGEEIGMTNAGFTRIDQYRDLETLGHYAEQIAKGVSPQEFLEGAARFSRDNSRTPMQWSADEHGGFSEATPWIEPCANWREVNVATDRADPEGVFEHYRRLIALRRERPIVVHGRYRPYLRGHAQIMAYTRSLGDEALAVMANLSESPCEIELPAALRVEGETLIASHGARSLAGPRLTLAPYENVAVLGPAPEQVAAD